ncbi:hypothetical protein [Vibrio phage S4-7]|nr:hypothetical protein [Vibrio phage S4-7]
MSRLTICFTASNSSCRWCTLLISPCNVNITPFLSRNVSHGKSRGMSRLVSKGVDTNTRLDSFIINSLLLSVVRFNNNHINLYKTYVNRNNQNKLNNFMINTSKIVLTTIKVRCKFLCKQTERLKMKVIYVDYSKKETKTANGRKVLLKKKYHRGGIGLVIVEDGKVTLAEKIMCKGIDEGEKLALLYAFKYTTDGDVICTDQNSVPLQLLKHGELVSKSKNPITQKLNSKINTLISLSKGITIQEVGSHQGDQYHNTADRLSKLASGVRGNTLKNFLSSQGIPLTKSKISDKLLNNLENYKGTTYDYLHRERLHISL